MTVIAYIGLGSNLGDSAQTLLDAWGEIGALPGVKQLLLSSPYRTAPLAMKSDNWFVNGVGSVETSLSAARLLEMLLAIEKKHGRTRPSGRTGYGDRTLDLDLLLRGDDLSTEKTLTLPHPGIADRMFVLVPLAEIAPSLVHPLTGKTVTRMLQELRDREPGQEIFRISWPEK